MRAEAGRASIMSRWQETTKQCQMRRGFGAYDDGLGSQTTSRLVITVEH